MNELLDAYCERTGPGWWQEPANTLSNVAFFLAAVAAARRFRESPDLRLSNGWDLALLIVLIFAIGIGSTLWHLLATRWAALADEIPILLFISVFLPSFLHRIGALPLSWTLFWLALFQVSNFVLRSLIPPDVLNGSLFYGPAWVTLGLLVAWLGLRGSPLWREFAWIWALFTLSLALRTGDVSVCEAWPVGTHFLWHLLNAVVLYRLVTALVREAACAPAAQPRQGGVHHGTDFGARAGHGRNAGTDGGA